MTERKTRVFVRSLGCKVNQADAAAVLERLDPERVEVVFAPEHADVVLLNTCTVTHRADSDARKILGSLGRSRPGLPVVVTGCGAVIWAGRLAAYPSVKQVLPPGDPEALARALGPIASGPQQAVGSGFAWLGRQRAFAKVQDGCDARCAYCTIPRVRGGQRSLPLDQARRLVRAFLRQGHREVVLTGIHLGRYGSDQSPRTGLADLLDAIAPDLAAAGGARVRLSSIEPLEWSAELMDAVARHSFVCRHFHVPLQSGDDGVLAGMGRPYRVSDYSRVVAELQTRFPRAAIGADVLVGFPGESDRAAEATLVLLEGLPVAYLHVFPFSPRPGTPAAARPDAVPAAVIKQRSAGLRRLGRRRWADFTARGRGLHHRVLVERVSALGCEGRSEHYRRVRSISTGVQPGQIVEVMADECRGEWLLAGRTAAAGEAAWPPA